MSTHFQTLENLYHQAPISLNYPNPPRMEVSRGAARIRWEVSDQLFHKGGALHGSVIFRLLDDAAFFAANSVVSDVLLVTAHFDIQFVRPVTREGWVEAHGVLKVPGRNLLVAEAELKDEKGRLLAMGRGNFMRSAVKIESI
jgi:uncharacterized protein (TIGR00369 family)